MSNTEVVPIKCVWVKPDAPVPVVGLDAKASAVAANYVPIPVARDPRLPKGHYYATGKFEQLRACFDLGVTNVKVIVEHGKSFFQEMREQADPVEWGKLASALKGAGYAIDEIAREAHLPRSMVLDRLAMIEVLEAKKPLGGSTDDFYNEVKALKVTKDPIHFGLQAIKLIDMYPGLTPGGVALHTGLSTQTVEERMEMCTHIAKAEQLGKVLGRAEAKQEELDKIILQSSTDKHTMLAHFNFRAGKMAGKVQDVVDRMGKPCKYTECSGRTLEGDLCAKHVRLKALHDAKTPSERGLVRCLEPECKKWIKNPMNRPRPLQPAWYFCKSHQTTDAVNVEIATGKAIGTMRVGRGLGNMPIADRDGDPIWITREVEVIKISRMEESHLTNCLSFLEAAAKKRCLLTGVDESKWRERAGLRFAYLLAEAKRRDDSLKCPCKDGVKETRSIDGDPALVFEVICEDCQVGKERKVTQELAQKIANERKGQKAMTLKLAIVMALSLIAGGIFVPNVQWFIAYLRQMGVVQ